MDLVDVLLDVEVARCYSSPFSFSSPKKESLSRRRTSNIESTPTHTTNNSFSANLRRTSVPSIDRRAFQHGDIVTEQFLTFWPALLLTLLDSLHFQAGRPLCTVRIT
mmetsp:Transcript_19899/g.27326  ORF Transcript_19899/g.27326 Transcript_19899/m.27326 type:complete len:107 (+) Transcript_19899:125-445(+)